MTVVRKLETEFKSIPARRSFSYELLSDKVSKQYALLDGISRATNYLALLTIIIASLGMFGLIALFARLRVKEIGIRKVLGASITGLITLLSKDFMILVVMAIVIATPVAWYIMRRWLQDFAYRTDISWWMFLAGGSVAMLIAFLTVGIQAARAAAANPVNSLRTE
jgi:putative ABC transport system permease protein